MSTYHLKRTGSINLQFGRIEVGVRTVEELDIFGLADDRLQVRTRERVGACVPYRIVLISALFLEQYRSSHCVYAERREN